MTGGTVRVARDLHGFAIATLTTLQGLAAGVTVNSVSVDPKTLPFDAMVIPLTLTAEED